MQNNQSKTISGFSKLNKSDKIRWLAENFTSEATEAERVLTSFWHQDIDLQRIMDGFSENTISNFPIPYGIAPNFMINGKPYAVPMVIEESSVVAAASGAAKYWQTRGGFHAEVISTFKLGQVHFLWKGDFEKLQSVFNDLKQQLLEDAVDITCNMEKRGGGVKDMELLSFTTLEPEYYQLRVSFETCDSMGANFINSVLEKFSSTLEVFVQQHPIFDDSEKELDVVMSILSNYTPDCLVRAWVECPVQALSDEGNAAYFAEKFRRAVRIAQIDPYRATTHNKGIFNGIDAVVLATGNDFRAVEACGHTYASRSGQYRSLSDCAIENGVFKFWLDIPLALGTVGGLTKLHPLAKLSLEILDNPSAEELMQIVAVTGLAQNFAALRSLVTTGIQKGHMKMHLTNILNHLGANAFEAQEASYFFADKVVSFTAVREFLEVERSKLDRFTHFAGHPPAQ
ncbi:MAG: hydroxymethylglutaryl-CoA reductase, degradative [Saprospiraceae bacterium]|nr:hydroxymethylglutaryl-CoA reductase, degradative [Saprospiraceae bacterium]